MATPSAEKGDASLLMITNSSNLPGGTVAPAVLDSVNASVPSRLILEMSAT